MELPAFNFYEIKEFVENTYKGSAVDRSVLLDPPSRALVKLKAELSRLENGLKLA